MPIWETEQFPILFHVNDPETFWGSVNDSRRHKGRQLGLYRWHLLDQGGAYQEVEHILVRYPDLRIIFAHFYFLSGDVDRAADFLDRHPHVSFDITPGVEMYFNFAKKRDEWHDFFTRYQDRIVFGSDNFANDDPDYPTSSCRYDHHIRQFLAAVEPFEFTGVGQHAAWFQHLTRSAAEDLPGQPVPLYRRETGRNQSPGCCCAVQPGHRICQGGRR